MIRYTIAIVDDEKSIRDALDMVLSSAYDILCFEDAEGFLASLEEKVPDLVLMDVGLPAMSGIEALGFLKSTIPRCR